MFFLFVKKCFLFVQDVYLYQSCIKIMPTVIAKIYRFFFVLFSNCIFDWEPTLSFSLRVLVIIINLSKYYPTEQQDEEKNNNKPFHFLILFSFSFFPLFSFCFHYNFGTSNSNLKWSVKEFSFFFSELSLICCKLLFLIFFFQFI